VQYVRRRELRKLQEQHQSNPPINGGPSEPPSNLDRITTPLLVVGGGRLNMLHIWEPYAGLRYLHKPVDLLMLNTDEHVQTNPAVRMAPQGGSWTGSVSGCRITKSLPLPKPSSTLAGANCASFRSKTRARCRQTEVSCEKMRRCDSQYDESQIRS
jgi:hypothetical protein